MDISLLQPLLHRARSANKYDFGHVLVLGGSPGMVGAPLLAGKAALRIGAGAVTIASDAETADKLERRVEEIMTLALPSYKNVERACRDLLEFCEQRHVTVVVIGSGLRPEAAEVVRAFAVKAAVPLVIDAGGLAAFADHLDKLKKAAQANPHIVLTPHTGEYARLAGGDAHDVAALRKTAKFFAKDYHLTVVLKGDHTLVAHPDGVAYKNSTGNPGLATAGAGDVLAGIVAGLVAQRIEFSQAVELAVYLHGLAGDLAANAKTQAGMIASDIVEYLPAALKQSLMDIEL